jgi:hypothetical protein
MRLNKAIVVFCLWFSTVLLLFFLQPFLTEPAKTYACHGMYLTFFGGVAAALIGTKIRTGSFFPGKTIKQAENVSASESTGLLNWLAIYLIAGVGAASVLKSFGWVSDRRILLGVLLSAPLLIILGYQTYRRVRRPAD